MDFFTESNPGLKFEVVINHEARPMLLRGHHAAAEKVLERRFSHWIPDDAPAAREALDRGVPVTNASPRSRMSRAISRLGRELAASLNQTQFADDAKAH
jgi:MinD-like ATPase involved in chromosome partitioning or flagellar assembly